MTDCARIFRHYFELHTHLFVFTFSSAHFFGFFVCVDFGCFSSYGIMHHCILLYMTSCVERARSAIWLFWCFWESAVFRKWQKWKRRKEKNFLLSLALEPNDKWNVIISTEGVSHSQCVVRWCVTGVAARRAVLPAGDRQHQRQGPEPGAGQLRPTDVALRLTDQRPLPETQRCCQGRDCWSPQQ